MNKSSALQEMHLWPSHLFPEPTQAQEWVDGLLLALENQSAGEQGRWKVSEQHACMIRLSPQHLEQVRTLNTLSALSGISAKDLLPAIVDFYLTKCRWTDNGSGLPCGVAISSKSPDGLGHLASHANGCWDQKVQCRWAGHRVCGIYVEGSKLVDHLVAHLKTTVSVCRFCHHQALTPTSTITQHYSQCAGLQSIMASRFKAELLVPTSQHE